MITVEQLSYVEVHWFNAYVFIARRFIGADSNFQIVSRRLREINTEKQVIIITIQTISPYVGPQWGTSEKGLQGLKGFQDLDYLMSRSSYLQQSLVEVEHSQCLGSCQGHGAGLGQDRVPH